MNTKPVDNRPPANRLDVQSLRQHAEGQQVVGCGCLTPRKAYAFAIVATAATLAMRMALAGQLQDHPAVIVFTLPIMLSAYLGGRRAGLLATVLCCLGALYFVLPPTRSFYVSSVMDRWDLSFLVAAGTAISVLNEALHRARRQADVAAHELQATFALVKAAVLQTAIFNSANFSCIATDAKGVIQIFNVGAERMLGYTAEEVVNKITPADLHDRQEVIERAAAMSREYGTLIAPDFDALVFKAARGIEDIYELTKIRKDGSRFPAAVSVTASRDAQDVIIGYLLIGRDNTARERVDDSLRKSEAQLQAIFENITEAVVVSDLNGQLLHFNHAALEMLGYPSLDESRRNFGDLADTFELSGIDGTAWAVDQWPLARILHGEKLQDLEGRMRRINGDSQRVYSFSGTLAHDAGGKPLMAIVTFSDITDRKHVEEELHLLNTTLEQRVIHRTAQLQAANDELEAFSYSVSHDLCAPLRSIDGFSQALLEDSGGKLDRESQDHLCRIRVATQRMGQLIDDLLSLARMTRVAMRRERVDLSAVAREVVEELRSSGRAREVDVVITDGLHVEADANLLRIVLTNLLHNAWKFTGERARGLIEFGYCAEQGEAGYFVRDNGVGFDMTYAGKLFGAFQRLHSTAEFPGTGIGLATVQRIVHRHGGRVWAEADAGKGATFHFSLPTAA